MASLTPYLFEASPFQPIFLKNLITNLN